MQVDDDYCWGGGQLHGLYDPDHTSGSVVRDFLTFCKLAAWHKLVPREWCWEKCLSTAGGMLPYVFEKSDAQDKYGSKNVFSAWQAQPALHCRGALLSGQTNLEHLHNAQ